MGTLDFTCAAELLGKTVELRQRTDRGSIEIVGMVTRVIESIPGDDLAGVIEVECGLGGILFNLAEACVDHVSN